MNSFLHLPGKGLTLVASVLEGEYAKNRQAAEDAKVSITEMMKIEKAKGFADVIVAKDLSEGLSFL